jgi:hypothetical protein
VDTRAIDVALKAIEVDREERARRIKDLLQAKGAKKETSDEQK